MRHTCDRRSVARWRWTKAAWTVHQWRRPFRLMTSADSPAPGEHRTRSNMNYSGTNIHTHTYKHTHTYHMLYLETERASVPKFTVSSDRFYTQICHVIVLPEDFQSAVCDAEVGWVANEAVSSRDKPTTWDKPTWRTLATLFINTSAGRRSSMTISHFYLC